MKNVHIESTYQNKLWQKSSIFNSSSAVFAVINDPENKVKSRISLLNHFLLKRNIKNVRMQLKLVDTNGVVVDEFHVKISDPRVYVFDPCVNLNKYFVGAAYINFQSSENLAIPFCAVLGSIECSSSVCAVHTYGRVLENQELGSKLDINETVESSWTLRDDESTSSFAILHNGRKDVHLTITLEAMNSNGESLSISTEYNLLAYGSLILFPKQLVNGLVEHLNGREGSARVTIIGISGILPRMMCGNMVAENYEGFNRLTQIQFTHTNFDFSYVQQAGVTVSQPDSMGSFGYFNQPYINNGSAIVYPIKCKKEIIMDKKIIPYGRLFKFNVDSPSQTKVKVESGELPSRVIAGTIGNWEHELLESECSTGIFVEDYIQLPCHWHWGALNPSASEGSAFLTIHRNYFPNSKKSTSTDKLIPMTLRIFDEDGEIAKKELHISASLVINISDYLNETISDKRLDRVIWYVLSGEKMEHFYILSTFSPLGKRSGYTEHSF